MLLVPGPSIESAVVKPIQRIPRVKWSYVVPDRDPHYNEGLKVQSKPQEKKIEID